jgi:hypothetical protein
MLAAVTGEPGRWIRVSKRLRDELEGLTDGDHAASEVVALWDRAQADDWIALLVAINRALVAENNRLIDQHGFPPARRLA